MGSICDICEDDDQDIMIFRNHIHQNRSHMNEIVKQTIEEEQSQISSQYVSQSQDIGNTLTNRLLISQSRTSGVLWGSISQEFSSGILSSIEVKKVCIINYQMKMHLISRFIKSKTTNLGNEIALSRDVRPEYTEWYFSRCSASNIVKIEHVLTGTKIMGIMNPFTKQYEACCSHKSQESGDDEFLIEIYEDCEYRSGCYFSLKHKHSQQYLSAKKVRSIFRNEISVVFIGEKNKTSSIWRMLSSESKLV